jgi:hypothetical protein
MIAGHGVPGPGNVLELKSQARIYKNVYIRIKKSEHVTRKMHYISKIDRMHLKFQERESLEFHIRVACKSSPG